MLTILASLGKSLVAMNTQIDKTSGRSTDAAKHYVIWNSVTRWYWDGRSFSGKVIYDAKIIGAGTFAALRHNYENTEYLSFSEGRE